MNILVEALFASLLDDPPDVTAGVRTGVRGAGVPRTKLSATTFFEKRQEGTNRREVTKTFPVCVNPTKEKEDLEIAQCTAFFY